MTKIDILTIFERPSIFVSLGRKTVRIFGIFRVSELTGIGCSTRLMILWWWVRFPPGSRLFYLCPFQYKSLTVTSPLLSYNISDLVLQFEAKKLKPNRTGRKQRWAVVVVRILLPGRSWV